MGEYDYAKDVVGRIKERDCMDDNYVNKWTIGEMNKVGGVWFCEII